MKQIISKYPFKCGSCGKYYPSGSRAFWEPGKKPLCPSCYSAGKESTATKVQSTAPASSKSKSSYYPDFVIDWSELRPLIAAATGDASKLTGWKNSRYLYRFIGEYPQGPDRPDSGFKGFTSGQMHRWVTKGYETDAIRGLQGLPPIREKRRTIFVEDGDELHIDRALSGEDNFMSRSTKREVIPGVKLNIELDASAGSSVMLRDYQRWIARTIYALETSGVDCEVNIFTLSRNLFREEEDTTARQVVRVKCFGQIADFAGFSAMFSPGAFRGIMFSLFALHAERQNLNLLGYGRGVTNKWGCKFNPATESIDVACHWRAKEFPETHMSRLFNEAIVAMRQPR